MILLLILAVLLLALLAAGYYFARVVLYPKVTPFDETLAQVTEWGWFAAEYGEWPCEDVRIRSPFGYELAATYYPVAGANRTIVLTHGIMFSRYGMVKYMPMFYRRGFNILLYDLRYHGQSGGGNTSFGFYEKQDLKAVVDYAFSRLGPDGLVGTMGESLGAATTLLHAAIDPRITFAIADSSYASLADLFAFRLREDYKLPRYPLLPAAEFIIWLLTRWSFGAASPLRYIGQIETPILFIHGQRDLYIPPRMSEELYKAKRRGLRRLYLAPDAGHVESVLKNPVEYERQMESFLHEVGIGPENPLTNKSDEVK